MAVPGGLRGATVLVEFITGCGGPTPFDWQSFREFTLISLLCSKPPFEYYHFFYILNNPKTSYK